jgi:hypothetical protein
LIISKVKKFFFSSLAILLALSITSGCTPYSNDENIAKAKELFALEEFPNMELTNALYPVYLVTTAEEFNNIRKYKNRSFLIMNDIDLSSIENFEPIGTKDDPFRGEISGNCVYTYGTNRLFSHGYCLENNQNTKFKTISNINIIINDNNFKEYIGVLGYTDESDNDYYFEGYKSIVEKDVTKDLFVNRNKVSHLVFNNISIEVDSTLPTIVGGIAGRIDKSEKSYIINSSIQGNNVVGGAYGIHENLDNFDEIWTYGSMFNYVEITPTGDNSYIGGLAGIARSIEINHEQVTNYNDIMVNNTDSSAFTFVGGIIGKLTTHVSPCFKKIIGFNFGNLNINDAKAGLIFGENYVSIDVSKESSCIDINVDSDLFLNSEFYSDEQYSSIPLINNLMVEGKHVDSLIYAKTELFGEATFDYAGVFLDAPTLHSIDKYDFPLIEYKSIRNLGLIEYLKSYL